MGIKQLQALILVIMILWESQKLCHVKLLYIPKTVMAGLELK